MRTPLFASTFALSVLAAGGLASAQENGSSGTSQRPVQQSAPSDSSHAPGHDAQTGKPESGEIQNTQPYAGTGQTRSQAETMGGATTERLDVPPAEVKQ
jgi:hypothetical protein